MEAVEFLPWVILGYAMYLIWEEVQKGSVRSRELKNATEIAKVFLTKQKEHEAFRRIVMDNVDKQQREKGRADNMSPDEILAQRWRWYWERPKSRCDLQMATDGREEEGEGLGMEKGGEESHRA